jgi:hypothetical protein
MNSTSRYIFIFIIIVLATSLLYFYNFQNINLNLNIFSNTISNTKSKNKSNTFTVSRPQYINPDLYIIPGSSFTTNTEYPYESVVPAIDVSRSDKQFVVPSYYMQYLEHNTSPFTEMYLSHI